MKKCILIVALALLPLIVLAALFTGIEAQQREHDTDYSFFIKQQTSFQLFFNNPIVCGECDVEAYEKLPLSHIEEIRTYCHQRFGLTNLRMCHAIFAESQRQVRTRSQDVKMIAEVAANFINYHNVVNNTNYAFPTVNDKTLVPECVLPLSAAWRKDADTLPRINVSCEQTDRPAPQNRWDVTLPVISN